MQYPWDDKGYQGEKFRVEFYDPAEESWASAIDGANESCVLQLIRLIERFADMGRLRPKMQMRDEGDNIYAIKARCGLRAYGFYPGGRYRFSICLFRYKKKNKMSQQDREKILNIMNNIERNRS